MWEDRSAVFFTNLLSMFFGNEGERRVLQQVITYPESYGARLLPIMGLLFPGGRNLAVLERPPDPALCDYFAKALGLNLPDVEVLSHDDYLAIGSEPSAHVDEEAWSVFERVCAHRASTVDGFVTDEVLTRVAGRAGKKTLSTPGGSQRGNNKLLLHRHLESIGLPVFDTEIAEDAGDLGRCLRALAKRGYECAAVKSQIGASGVGLMKVGTARPEAVMLAELFFHEGPCLVQGWMKPGHHGVLEMLSPSVQLFLDDGSVQLYDTTEQILSDESVHEGNESPPPYQARFPELIPEICRQAGLAGEWLHAQGYRGTASVDFIVARTADDGLRAYVCEINARLTGATYPSLLARHFMPGGGWLMRNLKLADPTTGLTLLKLLEDHEHLYEPGRAAGILPFNFNLNPEDMVEKGQFLCLGHDSAACRQMLTNAEHDLPIDWDYVRD
jgi:hypothetical protein